LITCPICWTSSKPGQVAQIERQRERPRVPVESEARGARAPGRVLDAQSQLVAAGAQIASADRDLEAELAEVAAAQLRGRILVAGNPVDAAVGDRLDVERGLGAAVQAIRRPPHRRVQAVDLAADRNVVVAWAKALPRAVGEPDGHRLLPTPASAAHESEGNVDRVKALASPRSP
jgi:hypothetical protein